MAGTVLTSCQNTTKKKEAAQDNVENARENLMTLKKNYQMRVKKQLMKNGRIQS
jgi:hypothetical protein